MNILEQSLILKEGLSLTANLSHQFWMREDWCNIPLP